jgi:hypothetical protein
LSTTTYSLHHAWLLGYVDDLLSDLFYERKNELLEGIAGEIDREDR